MSFIPKPHEIYKHFKGNLYQIVAIAEHTESGETLVIYQAMYGEFKIYARPIDMFLSPVDKVKYPDAEQEFRFELQGAEAQRQRKETAGEPEQKLAATEQDNTAPVQNTEACTVASEEEPDIDPMVLEFLDADSYEARLNILAALHHRITDEMITTMAIACDVEVAEGDVEARYESLKSCLLTLERYECNRLR